MEIKQLVVRQNVFGRRLHVNQPFDRLSSTFLSVIVY